MTGTTRVVTAGSILALTPAPRLCSERWRAAEEAALAAPSWDRQAIREARDRAEELWEIVALDVISDPEEWRDPRLSEPVKM